MNTLSALLCVVSLNCPSENNNNVWENSTFSDAWAKHALATTQDPSDLLNEEGYKVPTDLYTTHSTLYFTSVAQNSEGTVCGKYHTSTTEDQSRIVCASLRY